MTQSSSIPQQQIQPTAWVTLSFIVGVVILVGGLLWSFAAWQRISAMSRAPGMIVQLDEFKDAVNGLTYLPVVEFKTADGKTVRTKTSTKQKIVILGIPLETDSARGLPNQYRVGDQMQVFYDPRNPDDTQLDDWWHLWAIPVGMSAVGIFIALMALVFRTMAQRKAS